LKQLSNLYQALRADSQALRAVFNGVTATPAFQALRADSQALRAVFNGVAATPSDRLCMNLIILPERRRRRRETHVTNP
jgi:hypothetical protein